MTDFDRAKAAVRELLIAIGYDPDADGLAETPDRVARSMIEMTIGRTQVASEILSKTFDAESYDEIVLCRDVQFFSLCEHHLLPFHGVAHVAYVPGQKITARIAGLSKLARLVEMHARRLQVQERMTAGIALDLEQNLSPCGVAVIVEATHLCMCGRGINKPGASMVTSVMKGCFRESASARAELLSLLRR
jgi:GTP cyclohydrolase I